MNPQWDSENGCESKDQRINTYQNPVFFWVNSEHQEQVVFLDVQPS